MIRAAASTLFTATEDALNRALTFSIWALTIDHYLSRDGFVYDPLIDRSIVSFIETHAPTSDPDFRLKTEQGNTLMPLGAGFARLAKSLRSLDEAAHVRPVKDIPVQSIAWSRPFAYPFTMMFFNLARQARSDVLTALQAIGRHAQNEDVIDSRNWTAHGDRPFPGTVRVRNALDHISNLRDYLHTTGLYPRLYELVNLSRDGLGREQLVYVSEEESLTIFRRGGQLLPEFLQAKLGYSLCRWPTQNLLALCVSDSNRVQAKTPTGRGGLRDGLGRLDTRKKNIHLRMEVS